MAERRERLGLALEATQLGDVGVRGLDGDRPAGLAVAAAKNDAGAAFAGDALDLETAVEEIPGLHRHLAHHPRFRRGRRGGAMLVA